MHAERSDVYQLVIAKVLVADDRVPEVDLHNTPLVLSSLKPVTPQASPVLAANSGYMIDAPPSVSLSCALPDTGIRF